jgi:hypothetical protein
MEKEVKNQLEKEVKKEFLLNLLILLKEGKNPTTISHELHISKQKLNYYISSLKNQGLIRKIGYGVWEVKQVKKSTKDTKQIRGHAFIWKIKVPQEIKDYNSITKLNSKHIKYDLIGLKKTPRIKILNKKVWLGNNNIIIYDSNSYLGSNAIESRKLAVYRLLTIIEEIENYLAISLKSSEGYQFKPSREHYSIIKSDLAIQCNKEGVKLNIKYKGETWFIVDNSYNLNESETIHKETALIDNLGMQKFLNELKELNYEFTPKQVLNMIGNVVKNQLVYSENMVSHVKAIQDLSSGVQELNRAVHDLRKEIKQRNIKQDNSINRSIFDY